MALTDDLISFWKLDEAPVNNRNDSVGTNHLLETGPVSQVSPGKHGDAIRFQEGNYLYIADNPSLSITGDLTLCAWVNIQADSAIEFPAIISKWGASDQRSYSLRYELIADRFIFSASSDGTSSGSVHVTANNYGAPPIDSWVFVLAYVDLANDVIAIKVNNGTANTAAYTAGGIFNGSADFTLGYFGTAANTINAEVDSAAIWSRRLTDDEQTLLWNSGSGMDYPFPAVDQASSFFRGSLAFMMNDDELNRFEFWPPSGDTTGPSIVSVFGGR